MCDFVSLSEKQRHDKNYWLMATQEHAESTAPRLQIYCRCDSCDVNNNKKGKISDAFKSTRKHLL